MKFLHKYGTLILILIRIAIVIAVPFLVADAMATHKILNTEYVKYYEGSLYGLDKSGGADYLFRYNVQKKTGRVIKESGIEDITVSGDGRIYLLKTNNGKSDLLEWNKKGSVKKVIGVAEVEDMKPQRILASNKGIFYIYYTNEAGTETQRFGYNDEWKPVGSTELYYNEGFDLRAAQIAESGDIYFVSDNGSIYQAKGMAEPVQIFDVNNGPEDNSAYTNYRFMPYSVSLTNLISGKNYSISISSGDHTPAEIKRTYQAAQTFDDLEMRNVTYTGDTIKAGALFIEDGEKGAAVCGDVEAVTGTIQWSPIQYIVTLLLVAALLTLLYFVLRKPLKKLEGRMLESDMGILISVTVILMACCLLVSNVCLVNYLKKKQMVEGKESSLELADTIAAQLAELDVNELAESGETPLADTYAECGIGIQFFVVRDTEIYYASQKTNPDVPVNKCEPGMSVQLRNTIYDALNTKSVADCFAQVGEMGCSIVTVPLGDMFGNPSVMVVTLPIKDFWPEFFAEILVITLLNMIVLGAIFALILSVLRKLQKQLTGLMDASARVLAGELGAQADGTGINEVAATIRAFNRLSLKLKREEISVANCEIMTKSFTPLGLMKQINGGFGDAVVRVGSEVQGRAQVLCIMIRSKDNAGFMQEKEAKFQIISRFVNELSKLGGSIMDVTCVSLRYIDAEMTRDLFRVVAPIMRDINMEGKYDATAVLHVTDVNATIVGTEDYMILDVYETKPCGSKELTEEAVIKGVSFIVTDFAAKIAGLNRYHFRKIGVFHAAPTGRGELLYEAIDACTQSDAMKRWNSKAVFEDGLLAFYSGNLAEARRAMARVLIDDAEDTVARYYLKECEGYNDPEKAKGWNLLRRLTDTNKQAEETEQTEETEQIVETVEKVEERETEK